MTRIRLLALALLTVGFTACLDSTVPKYATVAETDFNPALNVDLAGSTSTDAGVYYRDVTVGTGPVVTEGVDSYFYYRAFLSNGVKFDSLQPPNSPAAFTPGNRELIPGFEIGLNGMRVGGRRQILVPPDLGYGLSDLRDSNGGVIVPGNSVLVFEVDLVNAAGGTETTP